MEKILEKYEDSVHEPRFYIARNLANALLNFTKYTQQSCFIMLTKKKRKIPIFGSWDTFIEKRTFLEPLKSFPTLNFISD